MTDPTLDWLRSEMQDARERAEAATEGPWWWERLDADVVVRAKDPPTAVCNIYPYASDEWSDGTENADFIAHARRDLPAALSVLDRIGDALQKLPEEDWMIVYETISWHDDRGADLLFELLLKARRRE